VDLQTGEVALTGTVETEAGQWNYEISIYTITGEHCAQADPDRVLVRHSYQLPSMSVSGFQGKRQGEVRELAEQVANGFNIWYYQRLQQAGSWVDEMSVTAEEDYTASAGNSNSWQGDVIYSDTTGQTFWTNGRLLCVTSTECSFSGGAHAITLKSSAGFDLKNGGQVTLTDLTDDPKQMKRTVREELVRQAQERRAPEDDEYAEGKVAFFDDWEETLDDWMERTVVFSDDGMQVIFGVYDIAAFVYGDQVFTIPYQMIEPCLNSYGKTLLDLE
jgi:hypothetical protein